MICAHFGECGSCTLFDNTYEEQLKLKYNYIKKEFSEFFTKDLEVFASKESHFRNRAEFRVWHKDKTLFLCMNGFDKKSSILLKECKIVDEKIAQIMFKIIKEIQKKDILSQKLFGIEFLSGDKILVTLLYHKKLDSSWKQEALKLQDKFNISLIGRSRKEKIVLKNEYIYQRINVLGDEYIYKVYENSFVQPNRDVNEKMLSWAKTNSKKFGGDLLELYCGHGNFTIVLSENFNKILATEISKKSIKSAIDNLDLNGVKNVKFARLSAKEFTSALNKERDFRRLEGIELDSYNFSTVFVDPPRAGVDTVTLELISRFENIIYISCNPITLKRDLDKLSKTHKVKKFAIFDQFPYTNHIECGVVVNKYSV